MNRNYKVIWNASLNCFMAVSEYAKARGKSSKSSVSANATINTTSNLSSTNAFRLTAIGLGLGLVTAGFSMQAIAVPCDASTEIKCGINATTGGLHGIAIGKNATVLGSQAIAIGGGSSGQNTTASGEQSIAIGANTVSKGASSIAIGGDDLDAASKTNFDGSISTGSLNSGEVNTTFNEYTGRDLLESWDAYGRHTEASGAASIAMGAKARSAGNLATAIGIHSSASGIASSAFGVGSSAAAKGALALGAGAQSIIDDGVALGSRSVANVAGGALGFAPTSASATDKAAITATNSTSLGAVSLGNAKDGTRQIVNLAAGTKDSDAVNVAQLKSVSNTVTANKTKYYSVNSGAVGNADNLGATKPNAMAMGGNASATGGQAIAIGSGESGQNTTASGEQSIAIGANVESSGNSSIAIGGDDLDDASKVGGVNALFDTYTGGTGGLVTVGDYSGHTKSDGAASVAIGVKAHSKGNLSTAVGVRSSSSGDASSAFGMGSSASQKGSVALGAGSTTLTDATYQDKLTIGNKDYFYTGATNDKGAQVSVGSSGRERQIKHVASGEVSAASTDAINGSQLHATNESINTLSERKITFDGDSGSIDRKLGETINIKGGASGNLTTGNIGIEADASTNTLNVKLAENIDLGSNGSVKVGNSALNTLGLTITNTNPTKVVSLTNTGLNNGGNKITNVAAGEVNAGSTDAVNGSQLFNLTNTVIANKTKYYSVASTATGNANNDGATGQNAMAMGGNATAAGSQAIAIGSGDSGQNTTASGEQSIAIGANVESSGNSSIAIGGDDLNDASKTAGVNDTFKYYTGSDLIENLATPYTGHTKSDGAASVAIGVKAQSSGNLSTAVGVLASSSGDASSAFGMGSSASKKGSVALGAGSTTITDATKEEKMSVGGIEYDIAGAAQGVGDQVSVGSEEHERQIKHVAGGAVNEYSTDAINGSQLHATHTAVNKNSADIALGLDFNGDNSMTTINRKLGQKLTIQGGETDLNNLASGNNIGVVADDTNSTLTVKIAKDLTGLDSATFGDVIISNKGIDNGFNRITNVAAGIDFTDAATVGQLEATTFALGKGWGISAQGANASKVLAGDSVDLNNTDGNIVISKTTDSNDASFNLNPNVTVDSIKAGSNSFNNNGLTIVGGPSVTVAGINANNTKITNLIDGDITKGSKDAVNGGQLYVIANDLSSSITTNTTNIKANKDKIDVGLNFGADSGAVINKPIGDGSVLSFKGGNNIKTTAEGSSIKFDLNGNINVESVTTGNTTVNNSGVTIKNGPSMTAAGIYAGNAETAPSMTAAGINAAGTKVTNVADGMAPRDAVNFGQLDAVSRGLGNSINELGYKIGEVEDDANAGISAAMAMSSLPQAFISGKPMIGGGIATYNGESAVAIGFSKMSNDGRWVMKLNGTADTQGNVGAAIGAGFHFD
ncbi:YadA-like family protein [uncultured Psychrobacter sp.]|uniref:YadA-like family protein n=1 Tax=uncultured Psychrobacter sp. TaxID=259303 RepID=UPI00262730FF|nr:YadA-like family protein [uncultured Psychrobacter sp.]